MAGKIGGIPLKCPARTYGVLVDGRLWRVRCNNKTCPDGLHARRNGLVAYHVFDIETYVPSLGTFLSWTEYKPATDRPDEEIPQ